MTSLKAGANYELKKRETSKVSSKTTNLMVKSDSLLVWTILNNITSTKMATAFANHQKRSGKKRRNHTESE